MFLRFLKRRVRGNQRFRNRPAEHRLPLEVPMSRKEVGMRRRRIVLHAARWVGIGAAAIWGILYTGEIWQRAFTASGDFAVGQFELLTNGVITAPQVAAVTGLRADQNITELDLGEIRSKLLTLPRVSRADIERRLPNHLSIRLEERRPMAWLACAKQGLRPFDSRGLLLDGEGVVFPCGTVLNEYTTLPVIHCSDVSSVTPGRKVRLETVAHALELSQMMRLRSWPIPMVLEQIHIIGDFTIVAQMDTDALFTFLPQGLDKQLARLNSILQKTKSAGRRVASVNLQPERNVPVTFMEEASAPSGKTIRSPASAPNPSPASAQGKNTIRHTVPASQGAPADEEVRDILRGA